MDRLTHGELSAGELAEPFALTQQGVSKHLAYLERAKLISRRREGRQVLCALNPWVLRDVAVWANQYARFWGPGLGETANADIPAGKQRPHKKRKTPVEDPQ